MNFIITKKFRENIPYDKKELVSQKLSRFASELKEVMKEEEFLNSQENIRDG